MKKWQAMLILSLSSVLVFTACGKKEVTDNVDTSINAEDLGITSQQPPGIPQQPPSNNLGYYRNLLATP